jgi:hypothetical protein
MLHHAILRKATDSFAGDWDAACRTVCLQMLKSLPFSDLAHRLRRLTYADGRYLLRYELIRRKLVPVLMFRIGMHQL